MSEIKIPELAESITEGTIAQWLKQPGETIAKGDYILELETDKVNVEIISEYDGVLQEKLKEEGDTVNVGETVAIVGEGSQSSTPSPSESGQSESKEVSEEKSEPTPAASSDVIASPAARKYAREHGIDLNQVASADPLGRVRKQDVSNYEPVKQAPAAKPAPAATPAVQQPTISDSKPVERIKMSRRRQTIAKRLVEVQHTAAMLTTFNEIDMTAIMNLRKKRKDDFLKQYDVKLGFMSFFTKAVVGALKAYPLLNAEIDGDEIVKKNFYDIGVAVSTDGGLVVPVVRDADRLNFAEIEKGIGDLAKKARDSKLTLADMQGGTFTITNGGTFGSLLSTPILNAPQVGILGMHSIQNRPVAIDNETIENRPMMYIALSYDHRIVDGKEAVGFLVKVKQLLEDPEKLLLEG
ncbi:2-oxoglutarate dehydrogenase complex dihydrolipoyllysine-residue succinyltransferase [Cytobacillus depressus]|uniref:Dihydrolipoyllysine-residue succinyltransferase component of 2-oxoglutarate dehydrogenase complex n=1 Tax=Cytobacillus depressus TaxID=1602942 RepID=A0A6L3V3Z1_9BACI|nr:2-oxoglutarate dehydrogenase complex dihydrolipoyllysine-residue succinyltransferase [Cytobacillus depressus]KAB2332279.1 2-oxoglutarate dehydrogenase complex dihydrolipoyllysine-residue succinyltransferase [Cytobacillus depressus]